MSGRALRLLLLAALVLVVVLLVMRPGVFSPPRELAETDAGNADSAGVPPEMEASAEAAVVTARVEAVSKSARAGETLEAAVVVSIADGWHVNANPASDEYLIPTEVAVAEGAGAEVVAVSYPRSELKRFSFSDVPLAVYEGQILIPVTLVATSAEGDSLDVPLQLTYQPCDDTQCLAPATIDLRLRVPVVTQR